MRRSSGSSARPTSSRSATRSRGRCRSGHSRTACRPGRATRIGPCTRSGGISSSPRPATRRFCWSCGRRSSGRRRSATTCGPGRTCSSAGISSRATAATCNRMWTGSSACAAAGTGSCGTIRPASATTRSTRCTPLGFQGIELLTTGRLELRIGGEAGDWLRAVRAGRVSRDEWQARTVELDAALAALADDVSIPATADRKRLARWSAEVHQADWSANGR
jgi:hypothetical protein